MAFDWNEKAEAILREGYSERSILSLSEIAAKLGTTRNSVAGRARRLGLSKTNSQAQKAAWHVRRGGASFSDFDPHHCLVQARNRKRNGITAPRPMAPDEPGGVELHERTGCCWPLNSGGPFLFCDAQGEVYGHSIYCDRHLNMMRVK